MLPRKSWIPEDFDLIFSNSLLIHQVKMKITTVKEVWTPGLLSEFRSCLIKLLLS